MVLGPVTEQSLVKDLCTLTLLMCYSAVANTLNMNALLLVLTSSSQGSTFKIQEQSTCAPHKYLFIVTALTLSSHRGVAPRAVIRVVQAHPVLMSSRPMHTRTYMTNVLVARSPLLSARRADRGVSSSGRVWSGGRPLQSEGLLRSSMVKSRI